MSSEYQGHQLTARQFKKYKRKQWQGNIVYQPCLPHFIWIWVAHTFITRLKTVYRAFNKLPATQTSSDVVRSQTSLVHNTRHEVQKLFRYFTFWANHCKAPRNHHTWSKFEKFVHLERLKEKQFCMPMFGIMWDCWESSTGQLYSLLVTLQASSKPIFSTDVKLPNFVVSPFDYGQVWKRKKKKKKTGLVMKHMTQLINQSIFYASFCSGSQRGSIPAATGRTGHQSLRTSSQSHWGLIQKRQSAQHSWFQTQRMRRRIHTERPSLDSKLEPSSCNCFIIVHPYQA